MNEIVMPTDVYQRALDLSDQFAHDGGCPPIERCIDGIVEAMKTGGIFMCRRTGNYFMRGVVLTKEGGRKEV